MCLARPTRKPITDLVGCALLCTVLQPPKLRASHQPLQLNGTSLQLEFKTNFKRRELQVELKPCLIKRPLEVHQWRARAPRRPAQDHAGIYCTPVSAAGRARWRPTRRADRLEGRLRVGGTARRSLSLHPPPLPLSPPSRPSRTCIRVVPPVTGSGLPVASRPESCCGGLQTVVSESRPIGESGDTGRCRSGPGLVAQRGRRRGPGRSARPARAGGPVRRASPKGGGIHTPFASRITYREI